MIFYERLVAECLGDRAKGLRVAEVVSDTPRGTTLRLEQSEATFAFKFVENAVAEFTDRSYLCAAIRNEATILAQPLLRKHTRELLVADGSSAERTWIMIRWLAGPSVSQEARSLRQHFRGEADIRFAQQGLLSLIIAAFEVVSELHELGYTHGDIQPPHLRYEYGTQGRRLSLIDFGLARRQGEMALPYRGALVHFAAPEVAAEMREEAVDIPYDTLSEIYSTGSVAFLLYTGKTSTDYGSDEPNATPFSDMLSRIADPEAVSRRTFASAGAPPFPALESVLERCLAPNRHNRLTSLREAVKALRAIDPTDL